MPPELYLNMVTVMGPLAAQPEAVVAKSGRVYCKVEILLMQGREKQALPYKLTLFGASAQEFADSAKEGDVVLFTGELSANEYRGTVSWKAIAFSYSMNQFLNSNGESVGYNVSTTTAEPAEADTATATADDLPF